VLAPVVVLGSLALPVILAVYGSRIVAGRCPQCGSSILGIPSRGSLTCSICDLQIPVEGSR
jgi:hypothetical protein